MPSTPAADADGKPSILRTEARAGALRALSEPDVDAKLAAVQQLWRDVPDATRLDAWVIDAGQRLECPAALPGRPARPVLVEPRALPRRSAQTSAGRAALLHAIAHIEFNAINLALDAVWRFAELPGAYYRDWLQVAAEEATHFGLLREHLRGLGHDYGDFDAHDGLWQMAERTRDDVVARMALVPRTMEARGLDATPPIQARLRQAGDSRAVAILDIILRDEIGHVAIGNRWYRHFCERDGLDPLAHYALLATTHRAPRLTPPLNLAARRAAGFTDEELARLGPH